MDWNDVRYVLALARLGSVRAAGARLGVSHSTVARRLDMLEESLGVRLFDRGPDGYTLTAAGQRILPTAERVEGDMAALERGVIGEDERIAGPISVTCPERYSCARVVEAVAEVCNRHPELEPRVTVDARHFDLSRREADVAVRALSRDESPSEFLLGSRVAPVMVATYIGREHVARLDPAAGGRPHRWLAYGDVRVAQHIIAGSAHPELPPWGSFDSLDAQLWACKAGLGLAALPVYVGDCEPDLVRMRTPDLRHLGDLWVLCHPDLRHTARVRVLRAALVRNFEAHAALFTGVVQS